MVAVAGAHGASPDYLANENLFAVPLPLDLGDKDKGELRICHCGSINVRP